MIKLKIKKAAMFGLDFERSRKQFGELFLEKRQSEAPNGANGSCGKGRITLLKHAAMFGLDARIALAIFGALSVISGAALYSAIQSAKATAYLTEMQEFGKAWESFYLDTGVKFVHSNTSTSSNNYYVMQSTNFVTSVLPGWSGPYVSSQKNSYGHWRFIMLMATDIDWENWIDGICTTGRECAIWSRTYMSTGLSDSLAKKIDELVDNSDGNDTGSFRWDINGYNLMLVKTKNPND